jgi:hypothetical protein
VAPFLTAITYATLLPLLKKLAAIKSSIVNSHSAE